MIWLSAEVMTAVYDAVSDLGDLEEVLLLPPCTLRSYLILGVSLVKVDVCGFRQALREYRVLAYLVLETIFLTISGASSTLALRLYYAVVVRVSLWVS